MAMANAINLPAFNHCNHDMAAVAFTRAGLQIPFAIIHYNMRGIQHTELSEIKHG